MDPLTPVAGLSIERYAQLSAEVTAARGDAAKVGEALGRAGVSAADWELAQTAWSARLADPNKATALVEAFESSYHGALDELLGALPEVSLEDFSAMLGEGLSVGLAQMELRRRMDPLAWSRTSYRARKVLAADPARLALALALAGQAAERRVFDTVSPPRAAAPAAPAGPDAAAAPVGPPQDRGFEQDASQAAKAVGKAVVSGWGAFGSAMDAMSKSLLGLRPGAAAIVHWSDGKQYTATVVQADKGRYLVKMTDGAQHWIPEAFVKPA